VERTFAQDLTNLTQCMKQLELLINNLNERWTKINNHYLIKKLLVKMRFTDFSRLTVEQLGKEINLSIYQNLLSTAWQRSRLPVRLIGVGVRLIPIEKNNTEVQQLDLLF
jgi:DNA polymerase-4